MNRTHIARALAAIFLFAGMPKLAAQAPPASFTAEVSRTASDKVTVDFIHHPIRHANFEVLLVQADGTIDTHTPLPPRTYIGTVQGHPGAIACGWLRPDGTLFARVAFEDGVEWISTGGNASVRGNTTWQPQWPTNQLADGGAGGVVYAVETGIDLPFLQLTASGGTPDLAVGMAEYSVMSTNFLSLRDAAILHRVGRIVIRMAESNDPYETPASVTTGTLLTEVRNQWNNVLPAGSNHQVGLVARPNVNGGLASVGSIGASNRYSSNNSTSNGDFSLVWRHEVGHNWGSLHYEGGGRPEGPTIMSDNSLPRFSSSELVKIIGHRNTRLHILEAIPDYPFPLPPRANMVRHWITPGESSAIDVMANDSDSNGGTISILSFDSTCSRGGAITLLEGAGPDGRDMLSYSADPEFQNGTGFFRYRIVDGGGMTATGYVMLRPSEDTFQPLHHWKLDETAGSTAFNETSGPDGSHLGSPSMDQQPATPVTGRSVTYNGSNQSTEIPALGLGGNSYTFSAWIRRDGSQINGAPILYARNSNSSADSYTGLYLWSNQLRVRWNGQLFTPSPTLTVPNNQWCLVAFTVSPTQVTIHLHTPGGLTSSTHSATIAPADFTAHPFRIARNQPLSGSALHFQGGIDDVRIFPGVLSAAQISQLHTQATSPPDFAIVNPEPGQPVNPNGARFIAGATESAEWLNSVDFLDADTSFSFGVVNQPPFILEAGPLDPGPLTLAATASYGDWGYEIAAAPVSFLVLEADRRVVSLTATGLPSFGGLGTRFVFRRDSTEGALEVPFTLSGSAVRNSDYTLAGDAVQFAPGQSEVTVDLVPASTPSSPGDKSVTLAITQTGNFTIESPSSATVVITDSVRSVASGTWNEPGVWSNGQAAPASGTQGQGPDYIVMSGDVVRSHNQSDNSQTMVSRSIRVAENGRLELARTHATTLQNVTYHVPRISLDEGSALRFVASTGSSGHHVAAPVEATGDASIQFSGGSYDQFANFSGPILGTGNLAMQSLSNSFWIDGNVRTFSILSAGNTYSGNWSIEHTPGGDDFGAIRAAAVNALGSGGVTVLRRSRLINDHPGGLDSLSFITLSGQTSALLLNQSTHALGAALTLTSSSAEVVVGNAASTLGSLSGSTGLIRGSGPNSSLGFHQTEDGVFSGTIGEDLTLRKQGPARLAISGSLHAGTAMAVSDGRLSLGNSLRTVASLSQTGGIIEFPGQASPSTPHLTVSGEAAFSGGTIELVFTSTPDLGVPYQIVAYGSLAGAPEVTVVHPGPLNLIATVQPGTGANSVVTAVFEEKPVVFHTLTLFSDSGEFGTVEGTGTYEEGTVVPILATPAPGWSFLGWDGEGADDPASPSTTVPMLGDRVLTARFRYDTPPVVTITASGSANVLGGESGLFTISRDSDLGNSQVFLQSVGDAVPGIDHVPLPESVVIHHGETSVSLPATALATATEGRIISLSLMDAGFYNIGTPDTASVPIVSRIISIADGGWHLPTTWNHGNGAPVTGTQGDGETYHLTGHVVTSNDPASNSQALVGEGIVVGNQGVLDLARLHAFTIQNVTYNLPPVTVEDGGSIRFRASVGSSAHTVPADLTFSGSTTLRITGGSYANRATLTGVVAGGGNIHVISDHNAGATTGDLRGITLTSADNPFAGDWLVEHSATGNDFAVLRSSAANALGTGTVTLDRRARLIADAAGALDSLSAITLLLPTSYADLEAHGWNNPAASLTIEDGEVNAGNSQMAVGTLTQNGGVIRYGVMEESPAPVVVSGNATFTEGEIEISIVGDPAGKTFEILRYQGTLTGSPVLTFPGVTRTTPTIDLGSGTDDVITATFPIEPGATLVWRGDDAVNPTHWDLATTANWTNNGTPDTFLAGDHAIFDDSAVNFAPSLQGSIHAGTVTFNHSANDYTLSGPGTLASGSLQKLGTGTLTLTDANAYSGDTTVAGGVLVLNADDAIGTGSLVLAGGSMRPNATRSISNAVVAQESTISDLINAGSGDLMYAGAFTGTGTVTVNSGASRSIWLQGDGSAFQGTISFNVVQTGTNFRLGGGPGTVGNTGTNGSDWSQARFVLSGTGTNRELSWNGDNGATVKLGELSGTGGHITRGLGTNRFANWEIGHLNTDSTFDGVIQGADNALTKVGTGTLTLTGANTYTGDTMVESGTLVLTTPFLADASAVRITTGATLHLPHGETDTIAELWIDGIQQPAGTYDADNTAFITGTGALVVSSGPASTPYDDWLAAAGLTPGAPGTDPLDSYDNSGVANLLQFALGGNPTDPTDNGIKIVFDAGDGVVGDPMLLTIAVRQGAQFAGSPTPTATIDAITYQIIGSEDLQTWTTPVDQVSPAFDGNGAVAAPAGYELRTFRLAHGGGARGFLRVTVSETP